MPTAFRRTGVASSVPSLTTKTPTDLIVDAADVEKVRKRLGEIGVATAPGVERPGQAESRPRIVWQSETVPRGLSASGFRLKWAGDDEEA